MTIEILSGSKIRSKILEIFLGLRFSEVNPEFPQLCILSPWLTDVRLSFPEADSLIAYFLRRYKIDFPHVYNVKSINLAYALLFLRLYLGVEINIVTLPPEYPHYKEKLAEQTRSLLDFLDEIGCNIFINDQLHAKLILSNDLALLGSCNLSKSALYDKEELAVCIDDLGNLQKLRDYATNIIQLSEPFGFTSKHWSGYDKIYEYKGKTVRPAPYKFTRGWLLEKIIGRTLGRYKPIISLPSLHCCVFVFFDGFKSFYDVSRIVSSNPDEFYMTNIEKLLAISGDPYSLHLATTTSSSDQYDFFDLSAAEFEQHAKLLRKDEHRSGEDSFTKVSLPVQGWVDLCQGRTPSAQSLKKAMNSIRKNLARESFPEIRLRIKPLE